jgi:uncharacterized protein YycO
MRLRLVLVSILLVMGGCAAAALPRELKDGDIVFHASQSSQSEALRRATGSTYTHMGMIFLESGAPLVLEAVGPVKFTPLEDWIQRGVDRRYVVKRLANRDALSPEDAVRLRAEANRYLGKPYDWFFEWSNERIYCSELVWKAYKNVLGIEIGALQRLGEFDLADPVVAAKLKERFGDAIPKGEMVISPASMFKSDKLETVYEQ